LYEVSPYHLKVDGCIFESVFQSAKVYPRVPAVDLKIEKWSHPAEEHVDAKGTVLPAYWAWRAKLLSHPTAVRYPVGQSYAKTCLYALWWDGTKLQKYDYIESRWHIYATLYIKAVRQTEAYKQLLQLVKAGAKLELLDVDCPDSIEVSLATYTTYLSKTTPRFGHTWSLALALLEDAGLLTPKV